MGLFTRDEGAKARRTQERQEQQKKEKAVPPPYVHTPTHALSDALLSVPHAYKGTDKQRLKRAHRQRLENEASALAAGSDTNVTNIPAKYWQGQPLPAQFKAPTPASLRELALSKPSLKGKNIELRESALSKPSPKGKNIELREAASAQQQPQKATEQEHGPEFNQRNKGKSPREPAIPAKGPSREPETTQSTSDQAAEAETEAEVQRLRRRVRELEGGKRAQNDSSSKTVVDAAPASVPRRDASMEPGFESRASSSDTIDSLIEELSSGWSDKNDSLTPPTSNGSPANDGVDRYDWADHCARVTARTKEEERSKLPQAADPQQRRAPVAEDKPCYAPLQNFSRKLGSAPEIKHPRVRRSTRRPEWLGPVSGESSATVVGPMPKDDHKTNLMETPSYSYMADWDFGFAAANVPCTVRSDNSSSRHKSQANKAEARRNRS